MDERDTTLWRQSYRACAAAIFMVVLLVSGASMASDETMPAPPQSGTPSHTKATYDETQPGADDPRVKAGFAAYKQGDFKKAYDIWLPLAEAGNAEAQYRVGNLYSFDEGVEKNEKIAAEWWHKAAEEMHFRANFNLAHFFLRGPEKYRNDKKGAELLLRAAKCGDIESQLFYGVVLAIGAGVERDDEQAFMWLYIAHENGSKGAKFSIERLLSLSRENFRKAGEDKMREWFKNHSHSCRDN